MRSQGKRLKFQMNLCASIDGIFNNLSVPFNKVKAKSASYMAADLVSVGDSWLSFAIKKRLIEPIAGAEDQDWFKCLCHKWKDWKDLWQPELAGRISMVNSPRQVIGSVLKYRGASYNSNDIDSQVAGGKIAVQQNLALLANQVRLFDSTHYLKAFAIGDVWVAVGWSSDVLPAVKQFEKKDHGANATDFFIILASIVEVSSFEAVYAYAFSLL